MHVYGFVGASGSGKSYRVTEVAQEKGAALIIDDGLLIRANRAVAGISAKGEKTKFASVKRALFFDKKHANEVRAAIKKSRAKAIMIVGTSEAMVEKIAAALEIGAVEEFVYIEDVSTPEEIETAHHIRETEGKHVIPVPTFEIRKDFSGYWLDPLQIFRPQSQKGNAEKTLIRPTFSYMGDFTIAHGVMVTICNHETRRFPEVTRIWRCGVEETGRSIIVHLELNLKHGISIPKTTLKIQEQITEAVRKLTGIVVEDVRILIKSLDYK